MSIAFAFIAQAINVPLDTSSAPQSKAGSLHFTSSSMDSYIGDLTGGDVLGFGNGGSYATLRLSNGVFSVFSPALNQNSEVPLWFATTTGIYTPQNLFVTTSSLVGSIPADASSLEILGFTPLPPDSGSYCGNQSYGDRLFGCSSTTPNVGLYGSSSWGEGAILFNLFASSTDGYAANWPVSPVNGNQSSFGILFGNALGNGLSINASAPLTQAQKDNQKTIRDVWRAGLMLGFDGSAVLGAPPSSAEYAFEIITNKTCDVGSGCTGFVKIASSSEDFFRYGTSVTAGYPAYFGARENYASGTIGYCDDCTTSNLKPEYRYKRIMQPADTTVRALDVDLLNPSWSNWWTSSADQDWLNTLNQLGQGITCAGTNSKAVSQNGAGGIIFWPTGSVICNYAGGGASAQRIFETSNTSSHYLEPDWTDYNHMTTNSSPTFFTNTWATCPPGYFVKGIKYGKRTLATKGGSLLGENYYDGIVPSIMCDRLW